MNEQNIIRDIVVACTNLDGFLVKLHSLNTFDDDQYRLLIENLTRYRDILGDRSVMDRSVAGCLLALQQEIDNHISGDIQKRAMDMRKTELVYEEVWQIINEIMRV